MRERPRVLVIGQAVVPTGYSRVLHSILERLQPQDEFEFLHFGINYKGETLYKPWTIVPNRLVGDQLGQKQIPHLLADFRPALVFMCHDYWFWNVHAPALRDACSTPKTAFYCPIEWPFRYAQDASELTAVDHLVAYTNFGRQAIEDAFSALRESCDASLPLRQQIRVIPHGLDPSHFYPLVTPLAGVPPWPGRCQARTLLFPDRPELQEAFIVLNANRNCVRKRIDITLQSFAQFSRGKPDAWLYLHMGTYDFGIDIMTMARKLGIEERLLLSTNSPEKPIVSDYQLNLIYNACDVGVNTSLGEGWGLVAFEHASTGAAQIVPDHSACKELWHDAGLLVRCTSTKSGQLSSIADVVHQLERLYCDREFLAFKSRQAQMYSSSSRFSWDRIVRSWSDLFHEILMSTY